jgi:CBS-domain-containing membrane protein
MPPEAASAPSRPLLRAGVLLVALMAAAHLSGVSAMAAPFSATCALLALMPKAPFSQPRTIALSHLICIGMGAMLLVLPLPPLVLALIGAWLAIGGMALTRAVHAPAVAHTVILALGKQTLGLYVGASLAVTLAFALVAFVSLRGEKSAAAKTQVAA